MKAAFARALSGPKRVRGKGAGAMAPRLAELALVILLGLLILRLALYLLSPLPSPQPVGTGETGTGPRADFGVFARFDPFGRPSEAEEPVAADYARAQETNLDLRLIGTYTGEVTTATIRTPDRKQRVFRLGDEIVPGVVLRDVLPEKAIIARSGVVESLSLQGRDERAAAPQRSRRPARTAPRPVNNAIDSRAPETPSTPAETAALMARSFEFRPARDDEGRQTGYALYPGMDARLFRSAGFAEGDVVVAVAGRPAPSDPQSMLELITDLPPGRPVMVTVERDGVALDVPIDLKATR